MKVKNLLMLVGLLMIVTLLSGCFAKVNVTIKDNNAGADIDNKSDTIYDTIEKTDEKEPVYKDEQELDDFVKEIQKECPYIETEGIYEDTKIVPESNLRYEVGTWAEDRDCLWNIANKAYGDPYKWPSIFQHNDDQIDDPDLIYPGQVLIIPIIE